jgi:hypothetical protein
MKEIERKNVWLGFELNIKNLNLNFREKGKFENANIQKIYENYLIRIDFKKQKEFQSILFDFYSQIQKKVNIGWNGSIEGSLLPTFLEENTEFADVYDKDLNVLNKIERGYYSPYISEKFIYKFEKKQNSQGDLVKRNYSGYLIWKYIYSDFRVATIGILPFRFNEENFIFYDIIEVGEHNFYDKAWLICISNVTGLLKWKKEIEGLLAIDFLYCKDKVIIRTKTEIHAYAVETGELLWLYVIPKDSLEAFVDIWKTKIDERFLRSDGAYKYFFTIGQNDILHVLTFQKYVQTDVHTGQVLNDFAYTEQLAKFNKKPHFDSSRYPIGKVIAVSTTHVIACVKNITVFINMQTGLIDHHILGEDTSGGAITEILIPAENVLVTVETCATKRFPNTILKIFEA